eukprot:347837-Chlamydomonas_euryale.AAC.1
MGTCGQHVPHILHRTRGASATVGRMVQVQPLGAWCKCNRWAHGASATVGRMVQVVHEHAQPVVRASPALPCRWRFE